MAKRKHHRRARRNPPLGGIAKSVFSGVDVMEVLALTGGMVVVKLIPRLLPASWIGRIPDTALTIAGALALGAAGRLTKQRKLGDAAMTGGLVAAAVSLVSKFSGGQIGLESEMDLHGAVAGLGGQGFSDFDSLSLGATSSDSVFPDVFA